MDQPGLTLFTFSMSHYSEKVRWVLQASGVPFTEVPLTPVWHLWPALRMGGRGQTTLPILREQRITGQQWHIQDSTRILLWLDGRHGPLPVLPQGQELRAQCLAVEDRFDAIGVDVARCIYLDALRDDARVLELWTRHASALERRTLVALFPLIKWGFKRRLGVSMAGAQVSQQRIQQAMAWLEGRLSDGRLYLVGSRLSVADITAASLLAPLACPAQHPVYGDPGYVSLMGKQVGALRPDRPALKWVRKLYDLHRGELLVQRAA